MNIKRGNMGSRGQKAQSEFERNQKQREEARKRRKKLYQKWYKRRNFLKNEVTGKCSMSFHTPAKVVSKMSQPANQSHLMASLMLKS
jgi:hypothetical protein